VIGGKPPIRSARRAQPDPLPALHQPAATTGSNCSPAAVVLPPQQGRARRGLHTPACWSAVT